MSSLDIYQPGIKNPKRQLLRIILYLVPGVLNRIEHRPTLNTN